MVTASAFKDHFSAQAPDYERFRPGYPAELFEWLAGNVPGHERAVDVGSGNGQAAFALASHFEQVIAIEPSRAQLAQARPHPRVSYLEAAAEQLELPASSADLLIAAQAAHWFDPERFWPGVRRVLRPCGLVALWTYETFKAGCDVDTLTADFYRDVVGPYWPRERRHVEEHYRTLAMPLVPVAAPDFELKTEWDVETALGYVGTWSAVQRYRRLRGRDPLLLLAPALAECWGKGKRRLRWPIHLRAGRAA